MPSVFIFLPKSKILPFSMTIVPLGIRWSVITRVALIIAVFTLLYLYAVEIYGLNVEFTVYGDKVCFCTDLDSASVGKTESV